jgi:pimeloyl-ACP methyl ester carboxylesterase
MKLPTLVSAAAALTISHEASAEALLSTSATITYHRAQVDGLNIFYREAGPKDAPTIVLLHGYPSSSRMFDTLIPLLATRYHLIAPDYPGFGQSDAPPPSQYVYTFDHLAETTNALLERLKIDRYHLYLQDYGGPVGFRIMVAHPERVRALIIQNANAYKEGLGVKWTGIAQYWTNRNRLTPSSHSKGPSSVISRAVRIPSATIPIPGPMNTPSCPGRGSGKFRLICSTIIAPTSPPTLHGRRGCASTSHRR